jgi:hypothetical protein
MKPMTREFFLVAAPLSFVGMALAFAICLIAAYFLVPSIWPTSDYVSPTVQYQCLERHARDSTEYRACLRSWIPLTYQGD